MGDVVSGFEEKKNVSIAVIQARMSSTRLPGKVLAELGATSVLANTVQAAQLAREVDKVVVATSSQPEDQMIVDAARDLGVEHVCGPLDDVLSRFVLVSRMFPSSIYVRLTADCPLMDPAVVDKCVRVWRQNDTIDLVSNAVTRTYPRGLDVEVISHTALLTVAEQARGYHRAHVTTWMTEHPDRYRVASVTRKNDASDLRVTVDTAEDLEVVRAVIGALGPGPHSVNDVIAWLRSNPSVAQKNAHVQQKKDYEK